jgi:hypothetical protein
MLVPALFLVGCSGGGGGGVEYNIATGT